MPADHRCGAIDVTIPASFGGIRAALSDVCKLLETRGLSLEEIGTVEIVLAEVLNNIAEHAFRGRCDGEIGLSLRLSSRGLIVEVADDGAPMPGGKPPIGLCAKPGTNAAHVPEGGYGWFMIRELARDVEYSRGAGVNHLVFRIVVGLDLCVAT